MGRFVSWYLKWSLGYNAFFNGNNHPYKSLLSNFSNAIQMYHATRPWGFPPFRVIVRYNGQRMSKQGGNHKDHVLWCIWDMNWECDPSCIFSLHQGTWVRSFLALLFSLFFFPRFSSCIDLSFGLCTKNSYLLVFQPAVRTTYRLRTREVF